ncbi:MAG: histidinol dehydrogenase [Christensenellaceae bacterium]|jgi:histidinol dehydrogenase|nr:histidinol dehydrogenase [Christensenellaceae bacterium]
MKNQTSCTDDEPYLKIIKTDGFVESDYLSNLQKRICQNDKRIESEVRSILDNIKDFGDSALLEYNKKFDGVDNIQRLTQEDFKKAYDNTPNDLKRALNGAFKRIKSFHKKQLEKGYSIKTNSYELGQIVRGLSRVGIYIPGGTASYPSTVLMNAIPAKLAGVEQIVIFTPSQKNGILNNDILAAAYVAGVDELIGVGGAHGIAAAAYGTQTIPKVDKIVGPGNIYVATAKRLVYGVCDIDMIAGPSEIVIIADEFSNPEYIAADLISQAEHDVLASAILLTSSLSVAEKTVECISKQTQFLSRKTIIKNSLSSFGCAIVCKSLDEATFIANEIAPEHLEILTENPNILLGTIKNAGSVFLGEYSPEPLGDYYAGANHVLPTSGTARFFSPLSVSSFVKKMQFVNYNKRALEEVKDDIICIAKREGFDGHANSISVRFTN